MAYDIFISYHSSNRLEAHELAAKLEVAGLSCWIAPESIPGGDSYGSVIMQAIKSSRVMVVVFSQRTNNSLWVPREVERAINYGLIIVPFRLENIMPSDSLEFFLSLTHWIDQMTVGMDKAVEEIVNLTKGLSCPRRDSVGREDSISATEEVLHQCYNELMWFKDDDVFGWDLDLFNWKMVMKTYW